MGLNKYKFNPGDKLPAENVNSIDPENITPKSAGYLVGGTGHSALSVFQALGAGANDGKFKINVDGNVYDNLAVPISVINYNNDISQTSNNGSDSVYGVNWVAQSFTTTANGQFIKKIRPFCDRFQSPSGDLNASIYLSSGEFPVGEPIKTVSISPSSVPTSPGYIEFNFDIQLSPSTKYVVVFSLPNGNSVNFIRFYRYLGDAYVGGRESKSSNSGNSWSDANCDLYFQIDTSNFSLGLVLSSIQTAIRTATGSTETVIYDTDHFVITSASLGRSSKILKLMSPSTGTDISGAGETPYLDMADNATETLGTGEEYNLVRLDEDGKIKSELLDEIPYNVFASDSVINQSNSEKVTTNTSYEKMKEMTIVKSGSYRVYFGLRGSNSNNSVRARIYKNDVAIGTIREVVNSSYTYYSEDFNFVAGDKVQIYGNTYSNLTCIVSSFQIRGSVVPVSFVPIINME